MEQNRLWTFSDIYGCGRLQSLAYRNCTITDLSLPHSLSLSSPPPSSPALLPFSLRLLFFFRFPWLSSSLPYTSCSLSFCPILSSSAHLFSCDYCIFWGVNRRLFFADSSRNGCGRYRLVATENSCFLPPTPSPHTNIYIKATFKPSSVRIECPVPMNSSCP